MRPKRTLTPYFRCSGTSAEGWAASFSAVVSRSRMLFFASRVFLTLSCQTRLAHSRCSGGFQSFTRRSPSAMVPVQPDSKLSAMSFSSSQMHRCCDMIRRKKKKRKTTIKRNQQQCLSLKQLICDMSRHQKKRKQDNDELQPNYVLSYKCTNVCALHIYGWDRDTLRRTVV